MGQRGKVEVVRHKIDMYDLGGVSAPEMIKRIREHLADYFGCESNWSNVQVESVHGNEYETEGFYFISYRDETDEEMALRERRENDERLTKEMEERAQLLVLKRKYEGAK